MAGRIFSPGKLLLTSEYVVLDGALALAIPTKWGQEFFYEEIDDGRSLLDWTAMHQCKPWLHAQIDYAKGKILSTNLPQSAEFILMVLMRVKAMSQVQLQNNSSYSLVTNLQFPADFGLGSSSTLMNNLAEWAEIDAFDLNESCLGGSGYDIAVAKERSAILFQNLKEEKKIERINFKPDFKGELIFIHLNQKQNSRTAIAHYRAGKKISAEEISEFSEITTRVAASSTLEEFSSLMAVHEKKLANLLDVETIKEKYFSDCPSFVKSLGAWGGDFVLSAKFPGYAEYFASKGFRTLFEYDFLIA